MAVQADGNRAGFKTNVKNEDEDFPAHTARGAGRPLMLLAAVVVLALVAWLVFMVSHWFMG
jgi:hypothetical protein